jgi:small GTP-binding protein
MTGPCSRVIFVGDSGVGKTSLIIRAKTGTYSKNTQPTIGAAITELETEHDGKRVQFQLWDTAGQEIYRNVVPLYFKGVDVAILVFSMMDITSFNNLEDWLHQMLENTGDSVPVVVCGNKVDADQTTVPREDATRWAQQKGFPIMFTSAVTGENVDNLVAHVACCLATSGRVGAGNIVSPPSRKGGDTCC